MFFGLTKSFCDIVRYYSFTPQHHLPVFYILLLGTVCDDGFGQTDADVACRELGYHWGRGIQAYGGGNRYIWLDDMDCRVGQEAFVDCESSGWGNHNCGHYEDIGLTCGYAHCDSEGDLRLAEEGRLEVCNDGEWGKPASITFSMFTPQQVKMIKVIIVVA